MRRVAGIAASMVGVQALTSLLGLVFWTLAARRLVAAEVGTAGAAIAMMTLLGAFGTLGMGTLLISRLPGTDQPGRRVLVRTCVATAGVAGAALGLVVPLVAVLVFRAENLRPLVESPFAIALMALATGLTSVTMVLDQAVLTIGSGSLQVERNLVASVVKIGVLAVIGALGGGMLVVVAWTIGNIVSLPLVAWRTRGGLAVQADRRLVDARLLRGLVGPAAGHHALNTTLQAATQLLPIMVAVLVSAQDNAYFGQALMIAGFVYILPYSISFGLFAAADGGADEFRARMRRTIPIGLGVSALANLALLPLGGLVLGVFGPEYATHGAVALAVLAVGGLPLVIKDHVVALRRVQDRTTSTALLMAGLLVVELAAAAVGAWNGGIVGLATAWVVTLFVEAAVLAPLLFTRRAAAPASAGRAGGL